MKRLICGLLATLIIPVVASQNVVHAGYEDIDGMPSQSSLDISASKVQNPYAGMWGDAVGGVAGRPYVKSLSIINGATTTPMITNGTATTPELTTPGAITMAIAPYNLCKPGQTPAPGVCYTSPNRLGMTLGYVKQPGQLGFNFSDPRDMNGNVLPLAAPMTDTTVVDLVINMNTWGSALRWTWFNGIPLAWNISNLGAADTDLHLKFQLSTGPSQICASGVPVQPCDPEQAAKNYPTRGFNPIKVLKGDFILSLDETGVTKELSGALFASVNSDLGSLETLPMNSPKLGFTYGVIGASQLSGATNVGQFYAFVSDNSLLNYFGVSQEVLNAADFATSDLMAITRADGGAQGASGWARTTSDVFGTSGYLLSVKDIQFTGREVSSAALRAFAMAKSNPAKFIMGNKTSSSASARKVGANQKISVSATTSACKAKTCRWVVSKSAGIAASTSTKLKAVAVATRTTRVNSTITVKAATGDRLSLVLQVKKGGAWKFVTSRLVVAN